jgi:hypothetical protein
MRRWRASSCSMCRQCACTTSRSLQGCGRASTAINRPERLPPRRAAARGGPPPAGQQWLCDGASAVIRRAVGWVGMQEIGPARTLDGQEGVGGRRCVGGPPPADEQWSSSLARPDDYPPIVR